VIEQLAYLLIGVAHGIVLGLVLPLLFSRRDPGGQPEILKDKFK